MTDAMNSLSLSQFKPQMPGKIDTSRPHSARVYDYWLGGRDNYEADRVHLRRKEPMAIAFNAVLFVLAVVVAWGRFGPYSL
jgi:hypothetical protein